MRTLKKLGLTLWLLFTSMMFGWVSYQPYHNTGKITEWVMRIDMAALSLIAFGYVVAMWWPTRKSHLTLPLVTLSMLLVGCMPMRQREPQPAAKPGEEFTLCSPNVNLHYSEPRSASLGDTIIVCASLTHPDKIFFDGAVRELSGRFDFESSDPTVLSMVLGNTAVFVRPGRARVCATLRDLYVPIDGHGHYSESPLSSQLSQSGTTSNRTLCSNEFVVTAPSR